MAKEFGTHNTAVADETREQIIDEFIDEKLEPNWTETQHDVEEGNEGIHNGLAMSHAWDKDVEPKYQQIGSNIDGDFLNMESRDNEVQEGNPEHSEEDHSTSSWRNELFWGKDLGSTETTTSDNKIILEDLSIGAFVHNNNNNKWPEDKNLEIADSSLARQAETTDGPIIADDAVTGDEAMDYLGSFYSRFHVQNNDPGGEKKKNKCDHDNDPAVPPAHTGQDTDKDNLATKAHISSSYSNSRNQGV
jgi:hypothetical protein